MSVLGIIAEYNPFHNGHLHHLIESQNITEPDYTIAIISGNFTQRGDTSIVNKWVKTEMALLNNIDLVIELPVLYATSSAENFAEGAIKILDSLGVVDYVSFGSEVNNIEILDKFANIFYHEPKEYKTILNHELKKGISYPKARENAIMMYLNDIRTYANILSSPNNILAIEYLKALKKYNSDIMPITIKRKVSNYNDKLPKGNFASATAIRNCIKANELDLLKKVMPINAYNLLNDCIKKGNNVQSLSTFDKEILYTLRKMSVAEISELADVTEGLEFSIKNAANSCNSVLELINIVKSKRYTATRIQRILLYALLGITKKDIAHSKKVTPYIRVLGFNANGKELLSKICKNNPKLNVITSVKKYIDSNPNKNQIPILEKDIWATNVYTLGYEYDSWSNLDFTQKMIII